VPLVGPSGAAPFGPEVLSLGRVVRPPAQLDDLYIPPNPFDNGSARAGLLLALGVPPAIQFPRRIVADVDALYTPPNPFDNGNAVAPPIGPSMGVGFTDGPIRSFLQPVWAPALYTIAGITRDATGAVLGGCDVDLFFSGGNKTRAGATVSDATTGAFTFMVSNTTTAYFVVSYKNGTPVFGTTKNTLFGA
jgi:hypothetical protein